MYQRFYTSQAGGEHSARGFPIRETPSQPQRGHPNEPFPHKEPLRPPPPPPPKKEDCPPPPPEKEDCPPAKKEGILSSLPFLHDGKILGIFSLEEALIIVLIILLLQGEDNLELVLVLGFILLRDHSW